MGEKCVKKCTVHVSVCVGGVVGGKCVKLCTAYVSVCGGGVVGGKCVKVVRNSFPFSIPAELYERLTRL